jgi:8-oxo-dGTP diphosphatase
MERHIVALVFRCDRLVGEPIPTAEAVGHLWARRDQIANLMSEAYAVRVLDALSDSNAITVRTHDGFALLQ